MNLFVLSELGHKGSHVGWSVNHSLEETLTEVLNPTLIYPEKIFPLKWLHQLGIPEDNLEPFELRLNRLLKHWYKLQHLPTLPQGTNVLLVIGLTPNFLQALLTIAPLLKQFDLRIAYLLDGFKPTWLDPTIATWLDHLFVISQELATEISQISSISTTFLPLGANTTKSYASGTHRWIDIISYGRGNEAVHRCLQAHFNQGSTERMYFHSTFTTGEVENPREHITLMRKLLSRSKISLCFEASHLSRFNGHSPLLYRWFEAWAAGCTIVGKQPFEQGVQELMDWENSTIEIPDSPTDWIPFFESLLADETTLALNARRNQQECMLRHDWLYRIKTMLTTVGLPVPEALHDAITQLQAEAIDTYNVLRLSA
ncbi:MAG: glycosyltransferase [Leptolyngbya sp. IPPAS B-1204]|nr:MAG: glycosyltransferase family 1 protein [Leptolyngbya sp. IPPAS B-1204]